jgi:hypothetical protein
VKLLKQPNDSCLIYSTAMVLDVAPEKVINLLGHDGQEEWFPLAPPDRRKRGVHIQEIQDLLWELGWRLMLVELMPASAPAGRTHMYREIWPADRAIERFKRYIDGRWAILIGQVPSGNYHACAWDGEKILDPRGFYDPPDFSIKEAWVLF